MQAVFNEVEAAEPLNLERPIGAAKSPAIPRRVTFPVLSSTVGTIELTLDQAPPTRVSANFMTDLNNDTEPAPMMYRCPMCGAEVSIERKLFGETVDCPQCNGPFMVEPPKAHPVGDHPAGAGSSFASGDDTVGTAGGSTVPHQPGQKNKPLKIDRRADDEWTETVVHPVVFRRHLLGTLIAIVLLAAGSLGIVGGLAGSNLFGLTGMVPIIGGALVAVVGLFLLGRWYMLSRVQSLTLTNERRFG